MFQPRRVATGQCPVCRTEVLNVQGLSDCPECHWTER